MRLPGFALLVTVISTGATAQEPDWLTEARARQGKLARERKVQAPDDWFTTRAPAKLAGKVSKDADGDYTLNLDIGAGTPIECLVLRESTDPPAFLRQVSANTLDFLAKHHGEIERKAIEGVDAGAIGDGIFMAVDWLYVAKGASGNLVGAANIAYAIKQGAGIYCVKTELGYTDAFRKVFASLVENFEREEPPARAAFTEIVIASIAGKRVGVGIGRIQRDAQGDKRDEQTMHMLLPATADGLNATTTLGLEWVAGDDLSLINAAQVKMENGELMTELSLKWSEDAERWRVAGTFEGKTLEADLAEGAQPTTNLATTKALREALAAPDAKGRAIASWEWTDADPSRLIESKTTITELVDAERANATQTLGPVRVDSVFDRRTGQMLSGAMNLGPAQMLIERVYVDGTP